MSDSKGSQIVRRIIRTELAALFGSPIAWFILVVFAALTTSNFVKVLQRSVSVFELYPDYISSLTKDIFLGDFGYFQSIISSLFMYIPLLTMGLIARETASGSIKLAYSSPVTSLQYVLGKFAAAAVMGLCLIAIPAATAIGGGLFIENADLLPLLTALLGLYLYICAACAIGLFMSSLTTYQMVAAVSTMATLAILGRVNRIGRTNEIVKAITYWLSINGRTSSFTNGILRTDDTVYFLALTVLFLGMTTFRISFPRRTMSTARKGGAWLLLLSSVFLMGFTSSRPGLIGICDTTRTRINSITENSKALVKGMEGKIVVNNYINLFDDMSRPYLPSQYSGPRSIFEQYRLTKPDIEEHDIYYYAECPAGPKNQARFADMSTDEFRDYLSMLYTINPRIFSTPEEMAGVQTVEEENHTFVREILYNGKVSRLRDFNDPGRTPSEAEITAALAKMCSDVPVIGFCNSNGERSLTGSASEAYSDFSVAQHSRYALINQGFDLQYADFSTAIPDSISMVVMADPSVPLSPEQLDNFREYIARGSNLILLTEPGHQAASAPLLAELGLRSSSLQLAAREGESSAGLILARKSDEASGVNRCFRLLTAKGQRVTMPGCSALETIPGPCPFDRQPLLTTCSSAWLEQDPSGFRDDLVSCNDPDETPGTYVTAYALTRTVDGHEQRIVVTGDADCLSNAEMTIIREGIEQVNYQLATTCFRWISDGRFPIEVERDPFTDTRFRITSDDISVIRLVYVFLIPLLTAVAAFVVLKRRRRG